MGWGICLSNVGCKIRVRSNCFAQMDETMSYEIIGNVSPLQLDMLLFALIVWDESGPEPSDSQKLAQLRAARERLCQRTGRDFGYNIHDWHLYLNGDETQKSEYRFGSGARMLHARVQSMAENPERKRLIGILQGGVATPMTTTSPACSSALLKLGQGSREPRDGGLYRNCDVQGNIATEHVRAYVAWLIDDPELCRAIELAILSNAVLLKCFNDALADFERDV